MAKSKEGHPSQYYKSIIKKQQKQIRDLERQAARGNKAKERYEVLEEQIADQLERDEEKVYELNSTNICPKCCKGVLELIDLKVRKMLVCNSCDYRQVKR